jgi:hypothetical protein
MAGRGSQVGVSKDLTERDGSARGRERRVVVAFAQLLLGDRKQEVAALDAVTVLDVPLSARNPRVCLTGLTSKQGGQRKPERTTGGASSVVGVNMDTMQAFEDALKLVVAAGHERGGRQPIEIVGLERRRLICAEKSLIGGIPRTTFVALTAEFKMIHLNHARAG